MPCEQILPDTVSNNLPTVTENRHTASDKHAWTIYPAMEVLRRYIEEAERDLFRIVLNRDWATRGVHHIELQVRYALRFLRIILLLLPAYASHYQSDGPELIIPYGFKKVVILSPLRTDIPGRECCHRSAHLLICDLEYQ